MPASTMSVASGRRARSVRSAQGLSSPCPEPIGAALASHEVIGAIWEHFESVFDELAGGLHQFEGIRLQGVLIAHHFELDPMGVQQLARHMRQGDGLAGAAAAGGIGQQPDTTLAHDVDEAVVGAACGQLAFQAQGHHLGARSLDRLAQHLRGGIASRAEQKAAAQADVGQHEIVRGHG
jgi:hypothetical protein